MSRLLSSLPPGTLLGGKYRVGEVLGKGGMGCVYKAVNVDIERKVAIKHLHERFISSKEVVERFHREARLAASIGHDNICEVIDFGKAEDGSPFLVMPRLSGATLGDLLADQRVMPPARITDIVSQTLSALQAAHDANIVHRDLKPGNIFVTRLGDREDFVKLLDFGISKVLDQDSIQKLTRTGAMMGTPHYMSPEQAKGLKVIDQRTDIWAIGVILYEALAGKKPFVGNTVLAVLNDICNEPFEPPRAVNRAVPASFEEVVLRAMSRPISWRFQSADEMRHALSDALKRTHGAANTPISTATAFNETVPSVLLSHAETPSGDTSDAKGSSISTSVSRSPAASSLARRFAAVSIVLAVVLFALTVMWLLSRTEDNATPVTVPVKSTAPIPKKDAQVGAHPSPSVLPAYAPVAVPRAAPPPASQKRHGVMAPKSPTAAPSAATVKKDKSKNASTAPKPEPKPATDDQSYIKGRFRTEIDAEYD